MNVMNVMNVIVIIVVINKHLLHITAHFTTSTSFQPDPNIITISPLSLSLRAELAQSRVGKSGGTKEGYKEMLNKAHLRLKRWHFIGGFVDVFGLQVATFLSELESDLKATGRRRLRLVQGKSYYKILPS